jgi:hypothetical protein
VDGVYRGPRYWAAPTLRVRFLVCLVPGCVVTPTLVHVTPALVSATPSLIVVVPRVSSAPLPATPNITPIFISRRLLLSLNCVFVGSGEVVIEIVWILRYTPRLDGFVQRRRRVDPGFIRKL